MKPVGRIAAAELIGDIHVELIALLKGLSPADWNKPTVAGSWQVRDIAAHLLDSDVRRLSFQRDRSPQEPPGTPIASYGDLVAFLNRLNAEWVRAARRLSPRLLIEFLSVTGPEVARLVRELDPEAPALFPVAWAGDETSPNWFDLAREYTEKWHHQQQIRDAVGRPVLSGRRWLHPVLDTFMRALPRAYRTTEAGAGTGIEVTVEGEAGDSWVLNREGGEWRLYSGGKPDAECRIRIDQDSAWRLMTKGRRPDEVRRQSTIEGREALAAPFFGTLAVMA